MAAVARAVVQAAVLHAVARQQIGDLGLADRRRAERRIQHAALHVDQTVPAQRLRQRQRAGAGFGERAARRVGTDRQRERDRLSGRVEGAAGRTDIELLQAVEVVASDRGAEALPGGHQRAAVQSQRGPAVRARLNRGRQAQGRAGRRAVADKHAVDAAEVVALAHPVPASGHIQHAAAGDKHAAVGAAVIFGPLLVTETDAAELRRAAFDAQRARAAHTDIEPRAGQAGEYAARAHGDAVLDRVTLNAQAGRVIVSAEGELAVHHHRVGAAGHVEAGQRDLRAGIDGQRACAVVVRVHTEGLTVHIADAADGACGEAHLALLHAEAGVVCRSLRHAGQHQLACAPLDQGGRAGMLIGQAAGQHRAGLRRDLDHRLRDAHRQRAAQLAGAGARDAQRGIVIFQTQRPGAGIRAVGERQGAAHQTKAAGEGVGRTEDQLARVAFDEAADSAHRRVQTERGSGDRLDVGLAQQRDRRGERVTALFDLDRAGRCAAVV